MRVVWDGAYSIKDDRVLNLVVRIPLAATPLDLLVRDVVKFDDSIGISKLERGDAILRVTLFEPDRPKDGPLTLVFGDKPLELAGWTVTDAVGKWTAIHHSKTASNPAL